MLKSISLVVGVIASVQSAPMSSDEAFQKAMTGLCNVGAANGHPAVDLNKASFAADAHIASEAYEKNEFISQICKPLDFTDEVCVTGTAICDYDTDTKKGIGVYGFADSVKTSWEDDKLVMTMTGGTCVNTNEKNTAKITFSCATKEVPLKLIAESQFGCYVEFALATNAVCGGTPNPPPPPPGPPGQHFKCMVEDDDNEPTCVQDDTGVYPNKTSCDSHCTRSYICREGECTAVLDGTGGSLDYCMMECDEPTEDLYKCAASECVIAEDGVSKELCDAVCGAEQEKKYKCQGNKCKESSDGTGVSKDVCKSICDDVSTTTVPPTTYICEDSKCNVSPTAGKGITLAECQVVCEAAQPAFMYAKDI